MEINYDIFTEVIWHLCTDREYREHVKDLSCLSKDLSRIVIVDNNPFSFLKQPLNGIPCLPFSAGQPYDDEVLRFCQFKVRIAPYVLTTHLPIFVSFMWLV